VSSGKYPPFMSGICGVVGFEASASSLTQTLKALASPMKHHEKFVLEECLMAPAALGRLHFGVGSNFSSVSAGKFAGQQCVCAGYITDLSDWSTQVQVETSGLKSVESPADLIAYLISAKGPASLTALNGVFSFALWQPESRKLHIGADRYGLKPLYYRQTSGQIHFASELKSLSYNSDDLSLDVGALEDLVVLSFISGDSTPYRDIHRVPIGSVISFCEGKKEVQRYWWFDRYQIDPRMTTQDYISESSRVLKLATTRLAALCDRPICTLTSGQDSRRVFLDLVACKKPVQVYSVAVQLKDYKWESDSVVAAALCREFDVPHQVIRSHEADMEADLAEMTQTLLDHATTQHRWALPMVAEIPINSGINFDGFGGDIFVYDTSITAETLGSKTDSMALAQFLVKFNHGMPESKYLRVKSKSSSVQRLAAFLDSVPKDDNRHTNWFIAQWARRRTGSFSQTLMNLKVESVLPYFDNDVADLSMRLRPDLKIDRNFQHEILLAQYPDLMKRIPTTMYPGLLTRPDKYVQQFVSPIPSGYFEQRMKSHHISVSRQIMASPKVQALLSPVALANAAAVFQGAAVGFLPAKLLASSWRLAALGLVAQIARFRNNPERAWKELNRARAFVYKKS
jgi:asparagine synthetase B (glutamine-hydrolysing)